MRKLILQLAISLDGFIEGPKGEYDWCLDPVEHGLMNFMENIDTIFLGRKTYEVSISMSDAEAGWNFPEMKEYVFSTSLNTVKAGAVLIRDNIKSEVEKIKNEPGKDIWLFGGADLTSSLLDLSLVDEISLAVHPVLLGAGKPLFSNIKKRIPMKLVESKAYPSGLVTLTYSLKE